MFDMELFMMLSYILVLAITSFVQVRILKQYHKVYENYKSENERLEEENQRLKTKNSKLHKELKIR